jgi:hypothetical protein
MTITLHDTKGHPRRVEIEGDKSLNDLVQLLRTEWRLQPWITVKVGRADGKPFCVEDKGDYSVVTQYDPGLDARPIVTIRVDLANRTFIIEDYGAVEDLMAIWNDLCTKYGYLE